MTQRISAFQLETMVSFMEQHGDLSRASEGPQGRVTNLKNWGALISALERDKTGCKKSDSKWRRTWSDIKNNLKKKVHKLAKSVSFGETTKVVLTPIEERIWAIANQQAAMGVPVKEENGPDKDSQTDDPLEFDPAYTAEKELVQMSEEEESELSSMESLTTTLDPSAAHTNPHRRRHREHTPQRRRWKRTNNHTPSQIALLSRWARQSDHEWRTYQREKDARDRDIERERLRLREIELSQQAKWQDLFSELLNVANRIADSFSHDESR